MIDKHTFARTLEEIHRSLQGLSVLGYRGFDCMPQSLEKLDQWGQDQKYSASTLEDIKLDLGDCQRCRLAHKRNRIVFGAGHPQAKLVFVGEGPGFEEDQQGLPFVGPAGQLLTRIIEAIQLSREQVYICNVIKCRPPGNRNPTPDEIKACFSFLERQLAAIKPDFIVALGTFAAQTLLGTNTPISKLRKRFHEYNGIKVLPTYHPAYLLRNPDKKRQVWEDMKMLMKEYRYED
ncbi:MAG: uracil-DNA glycosylase [Desulfobacterales bacterium]|jgi:DNA polymerase